MKWTQGGIPDEYVLVCGNWYLKHYYNFTFDKVDIAAAQVNNKIPTLFFNQEPGC